MRDIDRSARSIDVVYRLIFGKHSDILDRMHLKEEDIQVRKRTFIYRRRFSLDQVQQLLEREFLDTSNVDEDVVELISTIL